MTTAKGASSAKSPKKNDPAWKVTIRYCTG